ncbi:hypothetical protein [Marinomonas spartinae]|nr:hypothetical protein [Marinomonas spartinae]
MKMKNTKTVSFRQNPLFSQRKDLSSQNKHEKTYFLQDLSIVTCEKSEG